LVFKVRVRYRHKKFTFAILSPDEFLYTFCCTSESVVSYISETAEAKVVIFCRHL